MLMWLLDQLFYIVEKALILFIKLLRDLYCNYDEKKVFNVHVNIK